MKQPADSIERVGFNSVRGEQKSVQKTPDVVSILLKNPGESCSGSA
jgi:hypothetical protein